MSAGPVIGLCALVVAVLYLLTGRDERPDHVSSPWLQDQIRRSGRK